MSYTRSDLLKVASYMIDTGGLSIILDAIKWRIDDGIFSVFAKNTDTLQSYWFDIAEVDYCGEWTLFQNITIWGWSIFDLPEHVEEIVKPTTEDSKIVESKKPECRHPNKVFHKYQTFSYWFCPQCKCEVEKEEEIRFTVNDFDYF